MSLRLPSRFAAAALVALTLAAPRAHAGGVSKEMVQLQTQVQQLQDAVARLQQSNDERMGVLKDLVQQTADSVNKMSLSMGDLQKRVVSTAEGSTGKADQLSAQIQSLNDSIDEIKARMNKLDRALGNIEGQQSSISAALQSMPGAAAGALPSGGGPDPASGSAPGKGQPLAPAATKPLPPADPGHAINEMYRSALGDYMAAKYALAASEFSDLIKAYPDENLSGNAYFYLGEISIRTDKPVAAIHNYDHLLEHYPDNAKIPAAHLHKAEAMIATKQTDAGVRELRALIQRFPTSPESAQARTRLNAMGVKLTPKP